MHLIRLFHEICYHRYLVSKNLLFIIFPDDFPNTLFNCVQTGSKGSAVSYTDLGFSKTFYIQEKLLTLANPMR